MSNLRSQIASLFADQDPLIKRVVADVLAEEQEHIHLELPRGIMDRIHDILDKVARDALQVESIDYED